MTPGRYTLQGRFRRWMEWAGAGRGVDQGSHSEGKGTEAALKEALVSWVGDQHGTGERLRG